MSDALLDVQKNIIEASKLPKGHYFKAAYQLPNKKGAIRFTAKGRGMSAPVTLWTKGPKDKDYEEFKTFKNMKAAEKEYKNLWSMAKMDEANLPPHLAKFFDKKGNPTPDTAKRMADGEKKRKVKYKTKDVTPKGYGPNEELEEVSPPGFKGTVKAMKKHKDIDNPYALAWYMKNKGNTPHYKNKDGAPEKKEKFKKE